MYVLSQSPKGEEYLDYLPCGVLNAFLSLPYKTKQAVCEIRLRRGGAAAVTWDKVSYLKPDGTLSDSPLGAVTVLAYEFKTMIDKMCQSSVYAAQNDLCRGFITLPGGHRVGVCGKTALKGGEIVSLSDISAVNIRISREIKGAADKITDYILDGKRLYNTLIISPPACGKTTLLRDAARLLGGGLYNFKVGIVDERGEIAAATCGEPQNDIGALSVVYSNCPKNV